MDIYDGFIFFPKIFYYRPLQTIQIIAPTELTVYCLQCIVYSVLLYVFNFHNVYLGFMYWNFTLWTLTVQYVFCIETKRMNEFMQIVVYITNV